MKVKFLKNVTVDVIDLNDVVYDKSIKSGALIECNEILPVSNNFSNIELDTETFLDVRQDCFTVV